MTELIPKDFKNYYDRLDDFLPETYNEGEGGKGYKIDIYDAKLAYSYWMEEILKIITNIDGISKKKKYILKQIINASCLEVRRIERENYYKKTIKSLEIALAKK